MLLPRGSNQRAPGPVSGPMTDPTHDPEMTPLSLVQQLRLTADDLTSTYVAVDADGDPIGERPLDGSEEDFDDPLEPVEFEPESLHDMAALYRKAADELEEASLLREQANTEIARLTAELGASADPPNRAPLLASLEEISGEEMASACGGEVVQVIRDAIAAIRTDARVIEAAREKLKGWHAWARKIGRAEGDEYASAMPATLQARISGQVEAGQLALLVAPIRRRVDLVLALCADMGLGGPEAAELAPKAALWTDAEVAEIEAFRVRDWSGTNLNPFDHLPPALERTIYPGPGGRRAYLKRAGEPLPEPAAERQLGLPGLPKPETAMRLRLALIDKPDGPLSALVAGFAQALLEKLDKAGIDRETALAWIEVCGTAGFGQAPAPASPPDRKREFFRKLQDSETARDHHADLRYAMGHTARKPSDAEVEQTHADLQQLAGAGPLQLSEGADDLVATCLWELLEAIEKTDPTDTEMSKVQFRGTVRGLANRRHALMSEAAVRESGGRVLQLDSDAADQRPAPSDPPSPPGYTPWISMGNSGWALDGVRVADDVIGAWAHYAGRWTSWAREISGCSDGTDEELRGFIGRLVARMHAMRTRNITAFDHA